MYLLVIVTVIKLKAIVALYNKSLEAISYVCFEHVKCTVYSWFMCRVSRNCCYVWDPIYAGETRTFWQLIRSLYPTNLLLSFRNTLSLQRNFLAATLSFIDRGCYLEKQKKKRRRTDRKGGRGRQEKKKQIARQQSLWNNRMPPNQSRLTAFPEMQT